MGLRLINMQAFFSSTQNLYVLGVGEKNNNKQKDRSCPETL